MATKKKKSAPRRPAPRRRAAKKAAPAATRQPLETAQPSSNKLLVVLLLLGVLGLSWLGIHSCAPKPPVVPLPVPVVAVAAAPASPAPQAPAARSVAPAPAAPAKAEAPKARPSAHRETAGSKASSEAGTPALTFDRSQKKSFEVSCWRSASSPAQLDVFAPHNRPVRSLKSEAGAAGWVKLQWDGKNTAGKKVAEGLYFLRPSQEGEQSIQDLRVRD